jgi:hypothetical protein
MKKLAVIATIIMLGCGSVLGEEIVGTGVGNHSCAQFAKFYRTNPSPTVTELTFFSWAQGFMTGWNVGLSGQKDFTINLSDMKVEDQKKYLRDYCDKHPLKNYMDGVTALMAQIKYLNAKNSN